MRRCVWGGVWLRLAQHELEAAMRGTSDQQIESMAPRTGPNRNIFVISFLQIILPSLS